MISSWPIYKEEWHYDTEEISVETIKEAVRGIRNVRAELNVPPSRKAKVYVVSEDSEIRDIFEKGRVFFASLGYASDVVIQKGTEGIAEDAVSAVIHKAVIYIPLEELVDISKELERLTKEREQLTKELARAHGMLNNERFISKAPEAKVKEEKEKLARYEQMMKQVEERIEQINKRIK